VRPAAALLILVLVCVPAAAPAQEAAVDYDALLTAADAKLAAKQYDAAAKIYAVAARMRSDAARPLVGIARCFFLKSLTTKDPRGLQQAKVLLREARTRDAEWGGTWFLWGELSLAARDHASAVNGFRGALLKDHRTKEARPLLAKSLLWLGADQARAGRASLGKAIVSLAESRKMFLALATDEAYSEADRAGFTRRVRKAMTNLAAVHQRGGNLPAAEAILREMVALEPKSRDYRFNLGLLLGAAGKTDAAMVEYRKAADLNEDPDWVDAYRPMGRLASLADRVEEADAHLRKFTAARPEDPEGWRTLGDHLLRHDRAEEAVKAYERCLELAPRHLAAMDNLVEALTAAGRGKEAVKWSKLLDVLKRELAPR